MTVWWLKWFWFGCATFFYLLSSLFVSFIRFPGPWPLCKSVCGVWHVSFDGPNWYRCVFCTVVLTLILIQHIAEFISSLFTFTPSFLYQPPPSFSSVFFSVYFCLHISLEPWWLHRKIQQVRSIRYATNSIQIFLVYRGQQSHHKNNVHTNQNNIGLLSS